MATRELKATVFYEAGELTYNFPFDYIKKRFVSIKYIDNFEADTLDAAENLEYGVDYTINDKVVTLKEAGNTSKYIYIYRSTPTEPLVDFSDSSFLTEENLDLSSLQQLHLNEEMSDYLILHKVPSGTLTEIRDAVESANNAADNAQQSAEEALNASEVAISNAHSINIRTFNSVEEMKASNTLKAGALAKTLGFYSAGDGGGADYVITNDIGEDEADEANIIELQNGLYAKLLIKNYINIKQMGAKGDGKTDDTEAIQKSIDNFNSIFIPSGDYLVTKDINLAYTNFKRVFGEGKTSHIIGETGNICLDCTASVFTVIENLWVDCTSGNNNSIVGIYRAFTNLGQECLYNKTNNVYISMGSSGNSEHGCVGLYCHAEECDDNNLWIVGQTPLFVTTNTSETEINISSKYLKEGDTTKQHSCGMNTFSGETSLVTGHCNGYNCVLRGVNTTKFNNLYVGNLLDDTGGNFSAILILDTVSNININSNMECKSSFIAVRNNAQLVNSNLYINTGIRRREELPIIYAENINYKYALTLANTNIKIIDRTGTYTKLLPFGVKQSPQMDSVISPIWNNKIDVYSDFDNDGFINPFFWYSCRDVIINYQNLCVEINNGKITFIPYKSFTLGTLNTEKTVEIFKLEAPANLVDLQRMLATGFKIKIEIGTSRSSGSIAKFYKAGFIAKGSVYISTAGEYTPTQTIEMEKECEISNNQQNVGTCNLEVDIYKTDEKFVISFRLKVTGQGTNFVDDFYAFNPIIEFAHNFSVLSAPKFYF